MERHQRRGQGLQRERGCDLVDGPGPPAPSSAAFPSDPFKANGLSVAGAEKYSGSPRRLTIWGGTITSISRPVHSGSVNGNSSADILVRFRSTGSAVLLAWGGTSPSRGIGTPPQAVLATRASLVSGAPWHMRTLQLDGAATRTRTAASSRAPSWASCHPRPSRRPTTDARAASGPGADPATTVEPGSAERADRSNPAAHDPGPLGTVPPTSTTAVRPVDPSGGIVLVYVAVLTLGLVALEQTRRAERERVRALRIECIASP